jgi:hypothetical protein
MCDDAPASADQRAIRRAIRFPSQYLAAALAEITDTELALELGADPARIGRLRTCFYPQTPGWGDESWDAALARMADLPGSSSLLLVARLRTLTAARARWKATHGSEPSA